MSRCPRSFFCDMQDKKVNKLKAVNKIRKRHGLPQEEIPIQYQDVVLDRQTDYIPEDKIPYQTDLTRHMRGLGLGNLAIEQMNHYFDSVFSQEIIHQRAAERLFPRIAELSEVPQATQRDEEDLHEVGLGVHPVVFDTLSSQGRSYIDWPVYEHQNTATPFENQPYPSYSYKPLLAERKSNLREQRNRGFITDKVYRQELKRLANNPTNRDFTFGLESEGSEE